MEKAIDKKGRKRSPVMRALARCAAGALFLLNPNFDLFDFLIRIVSLPLRFMVGYNEKTFILIFTLAFALLEAMYLLPAFYYLFDGTSYLTLRYGGSSAKKRAPRIISFIFAVGRAVLNVLPELRYLPSEYYDIEFEGTVCAGTTRLSGRLPRS